MDAELQDKRSAAVRALEALGIEQDLARRVVDDLTRRARLDDLQGAVDTFKRAVRDMFEPVVAQIERAGDRMREAFAEFAELAAPHKKERPRIARSMRLREPYWPPVAVIDVTQRAPRLPFARCTAWLDVGSWSGPRERRPRRRRIRTWERGFNL